jgi:uncharacterized membrane protein YhaH (DUF805 family)
MSNPYAAPDAVLSEITDDEPYEPQILSVKGRIGRLRYLAYSWGITFVLMIVMGIAAAVLIPMYAKRNAEPGMGLGWQLNLILILVAAGYLLIMAVIVIMAKRRFNDLDKSGWYTLLFIVPIVNIFAALYALVWPGTKGSNNYGPQPVKNSAGVIVIMVLMLIIMVAYTTFAIQGYENYKARAQAARMQQNR